LISLASTSAFPVDISPNDAVTGSILDASGKETGVGFVRERDGTLLRLQSPSHTGTGGLSPVAINVAGAVVGTIQSDSHRFARRAFLRTPSNALTMFETNLPDALPYTAPTALNDAGAIVGVYFSAIAGYSGFVRDVSGFCVPIIMPGHAAYMGGTFPIAIMNDGVVIGYSVYSDGESLGFLRAVEGDITTFNVHSAYATHPTGVSNSRFITGWFQATSDATATHGFLTATQLIH
jgi:hypothetical protein